MAEIKVQPIMDAYRCTYEEVEEVIDLFNLDFEECNQASLAKGYLPEEYLQVVAEQEEICYMNNDVQKRGTSFPIFFLDSMDPETIWDSLMDTGATRSCMNYSTFRELGNGNLRQKGTLTVTAADGGNL